MFSCVQLASAIIWVHSFTSNYCRTEGMKRKQVMLPWRETQSTRWQGLRLTLLKRSKILIRATVWELVTGRDLFYLAIVVGSRKNWIRWFIRIWYYIRWWYVVAYVSGDITALIRMYSSFKIKTYNVRPSGDFWVEQHSRLEI